MAVTAYLGLAGPLAAGVAGWIARLKADLGRIDQASAGLGAAVNLLVNPRLAIWQRQDRLGQTSWSANNAFTADRWSISLVGASALTVTRGATADGGPFVAHLSYTHAGGGSATLEQTVEQWTQLHGRVVTFSARVLCAVPNAVRLVVDDLATLSQSDFHSGSGAWETLSCSFTVGATPTVVKAAVFFSASATADVHNFSLVLGSTPLAGAFLNPQQELDRCLRYLEVLGGASGYPYLSGYGTAAGVKEVVNLPFAVPKGGTPTVTLAGTWTKSPGTIANPVVQGVTERGIALSITSDATGQFEATPNTATIAAEWNPS